MARILTTVQDLIDQVRNQLDEQNRESVTTDGDILPSLNRGQDFAFDILARKYPEPLLAYTTLDIVAGQAEYPLPEDCFEDRLEKVEISLNNQNPAGGRTQIECKRISYRDITGYESPSPANIPYYYCVVGNKIRLVPNPTGLYDARIWYLRSPEQLVLPQGRVTLVNTTDNYVLVDSPGADITTESDELEAYINIVDGQTGIVKGTVQVQSVTDNRIKFRTTPTRSKVLNRTINSGLAGIPVEPDDYLAIVTGTSVPYYSRPISNFLIQFAVSEITRKLGGESEKEAVILQKFEQQVERTWVGREQSLRINKAARSWRPHGNRWFWDY